MSLLHIFYNRGTDLWKPTDIFILKRTYMAYDREFRNQVESATLTNDSICFWVLIF